MTEATPFQLQVKGLQCERGEHVLFSDLYFEINPGELHLLEGINGSGKTTLLRTIAGYTLPYAGTISWNTKPASLSNPEYTQSYRYVGHHNGLKQVLTVEENLSFAQSLYDSVTKVSVSEVLSRLKLTAKQHQLVQTLSQGQQRKTSLARLLLAPASLWVLDEPFTSLDHESRQLLETLLKEHLDQGGSAIMATHHPLEHFESDQIQRIGLSDA